MGALKQLARHFVPEPIRLRLRIRKHARQYYKRYFGERARLIVPLMRQTGEFSNFTYDLTDRSVLYLIEMISLALDRRASELEPFVDELLDDQELKAAACAGEARKLHSPFGRRIGWYLVARATKPSVIVETGVERGHGALLLCAALLRNAAEGSPGRYYGTDINPAAGRMLSGKYATTGKILYGDSISSLERLNETIGLFVNDSDHSADYEFREYRTVAPKLADDAVILGDNAHLTDSLLRYSREAGRRFLFIPEEPKNHWYPGAGIGVSLPPRR